jgi:hypothetical protein
MNRALYESGGPRPAYWTEEKRGEFASFLSTDPTASDVVPEFGGVREIRFADVVEAAAFDLVTDECLEMGAQGNPGRFTLEGRDDRRRAEASSGALG